MKVDYEVEINNMKPEHFEFIKKIKSELQNEFDKYPDFDSTWNILRFCRARNWIYKKVIVMLKNYFSFREKYNFKEIESISLNKNSLLLENHARGFIGFDYEGRPVVVESVHLSKPKNILDKISDDEISKYFIGIYERMIHIVFPVLSNKFEKKIDKTFLIIDLNHINITSFFDSKLKSFLKLSSDISQNYYPEFLGVSCILNAPWIFKGIWQMIKMWLDTKTVKKFIIESGGGKKELEKHLDIRILPKSLGGEFTGELNDFNSLWKEEMLRSFENKTFFLSNPELEYKYFLTKEEQEAKELKYHNTKLNEGFEELSLIEKNNIQQINYDFYKNNIKHNVLTLKYKNSLNHYNIKEANECTPTTEVKNLNNYNVNISVTKTY